MTDVSSAGPAPGADFIQFEVRDGIRRVRCNVSNEALDAVSGREIPATIALRRKSFDQFRTLIDTAAKLKLKTLPPGFTGPLILSSRDLRCVPPVRRRELRRHRVMDPS